MERNLVELQQAYQRAIRPPERLGIIEWIETYLRFSDRSSSDPGPVVLWSWQKQVIELIESGQVQFITVQKSARAGYTKLIICLAAYYAANGQRSICILVPRESDMRTYAIDEINRLFDDSPRLKGLVHNVGMGWHGSGDRDTMFTKTFSTGASLKILSAMTAANLRHHDISVFTDRRTRRI